MATDKIDMRFFDKASIQKYYANLLYKRLL